MLGVLFEDIVQHEDGLASLLSDSDGYNKYMGHYHL